jgi:type III secretion system low calcium response chaperone LcrH/SycD
MDDFDMNESEFAIPKEILEKIKDPLVLKRASEENLSFQEILGYNEETMENFYSAAYDLFQQKRYRSSANAFVFLTILNPHIPSYWLGLAMSEQMTEEYETAIVSYSMSILLDPTNPVPYFHSAKCLFATQEQQKALLSLELAIEHSGDLSQHQEMKRQAMAILQSKKPTSPS